MSCQLGKEEILYAPYMYTVFRKKHPLTLSVLSPWKMFRFPQNFQAMFGRKKVFH